MADGLQFPRYSEYEAIVLADHEPVPNYGLFLNFRKGDHALLTAAAAQRGLDLYEFVYRTATLVAEKILDGTDQERSQ